MTVKAYSDVAAGENGSKLSAEISFMAAPARKHFFFIFSDERVRSAEKPLGPVKSGISAEAIDKYRLSSPVTIAVLRSQTHPKVPVCVRKREKFGGQKKTSMEEVE